MSVRVMDTVMRHSRASGNDRLVLLVLADHAHDDGAGAYPSQATIAAKAGCSERTVRNSLKRLEEAGEIEREGKVGRTIIYRIALDSGNGLPESEAEGKRQDLPESDDIPAKHAGHSGNGLPSNRPSTNARTSDVTTPSHLLPVIANLNRTVEGKGARDLKLAAALKACEDFADRDLAAEADKFAHYWLDGQGEHRKLRDVVAAWRNWLRTAPSAKKVRALREHPADRRVREIREARERRTFDSTAREVA